ncbi:MAG: hypothetical protein Kow00121_38730 [Elainellaceae cyanobacterium]
MVGSVTTQGDRAIGADLARQQFGLDGRGITIGVISDSFNALREARANQRSGDLPGQGNPDGLTRPVQVLRDRQGTDEGRALLQIIFDIAPRANLLFHTAGTNEQDFAQAIQALAQAGADIIVDDILVATSPFFQDGLVAQTVQSVTEQGIVYVTSAGNSGDRSYDSPFRGSAGFRFEDSSYEAHDFDPEQEIDLFQDIQIPANASINLILNWDEPLGQVKSDLELFVLDSPQLPGAGGNILSDSTIVSRDDAIPSKQLLYTSSERETVYLLIARKTDTETAAPNRLKWISFANRADAGTTYQYVNGSSASSASTAASTDVSTVYGHQNAAGAIAVGATSFRQTPAFGVQSPILEAFSSRGSVPILFSKQGDRLPSPEIRQKPDVIAPNRVATSLRQFRPFVGTSAAAPHVAAVVALMLQRAGGRRSLAPAQVRAALQSGVIPVRSPLTTDTRAGLIQVPAAVLQAAVLNLQGTEQNDRLQGSPTAENFWGLAGQDTIAGGAGFDAIFGGSDTDRLLGNRGNDYLVGNAGDDRLIGSFSHDYLVGGLGHDRLLGNQGHDQLHGGKGQDTLAGGRGRNQLFGGRGKDVFILKLQGFAQIQDFRQGVDRLTLSSGLRAKSLEFDQVGQDTIISVNDRLIARLSNVQLNQFG